MDHLTSCNSYSKKTEYHLIDMRSELHFSYWHSRWESNPDLRFRRPMFYPLNYRSWWRGMKHRNRLRVKLIDSRCFRLSEKLGVWFGFRGPVDRLGLRPRDEEREAMIDAWRNRVKKFSFGVDIARPRWDWVSLSIEITLAKLPPTNENASQSQVGPLIKNTN